MPEATEISLLYVENTDTPQLIHCSADAGCVSKTTTTNAYFYKDEKILYKFRF